MNPIANELLQLRTNDQDVALVFDAFTEIDRIYKECLEAMGATIRSAPDVMNSATVTFSFDSYQNASATTKV